LTKEFATKRPLATIFFVSIASWRFPAWVSTYSWTLIFDPLKATGFYSVESQESFALDTRLHPPA
jgi:hypothetical protein